MSCRSLAGATLVLGLAAAGCAGPAEPVSRSSASSAGVSATTPTVSPTITPSAIPDDFPLGAGLVDDNANQVTGPAPDGPGIDLHPVCGLDVWPGSLADRLAVQRVGEESSDTRELVVYGSVAAARAVIVAVRDALDGCPVQTGVPRPQANRYVRLANPNPTARHPAVVFTETLPRDRPGGAVFVFARVGRAVLGTAQGGEWTTESRVAGAEHLLAADTDLIAAMNVFAPEAR